MGTIFKLLALLEPNEFQNRRSCKVPRADERDGTKSGKESVGRAYLRITKGALKVIHLKSMIRSCCSSEFQSW